MFFPKFIAANYWRIPHEDKANWTIASTEPSTSAYLTQYLMDNNPNSWFLTQDHYRAWIQASSFEKEGSTLCVWWKDL